MILKVIFKLGHTFIPLLASASFNTIYVHKHNNMDRKLCRPLTDLCPVNSHRHINQTIA